MDITERVDYAKNILIEHEKKISNSKPVNYSTSNSQIVQPGMCTLHSMVIRMKIFTPYC